MRLAPDSEREREENFICVICEICGFLDSNFRRSSQPGVAGGFQEETKADSAYEISARMYNFVKFSVNSWLVS